MNFFALAALSLTATASAQQLPNAVVWLPPENFSQWSSVDALLRSSRTIKLTIGLTPKMATPLIKETLTPWIQLGRIELSARIDGDPILTMVTKHPLALRPQDTLELAVEARENLQKKLGLSPTGFIPGAGAVDAAIAAALSVSGSNWILTGPYTTAEAPWVMSNRTVLVPSSATSLYDESFSTASVFLVAATNLPRPNQEWKTIGELALSKSAGAIHLSTVTAWPEWGTKAPLDAGAKAAWDAYGAAAMTLNRYQNSGAADLGTLDAAVELLHKSQAARHYRATGSESIPSDLRALFLAFYKRLNLPAPDALYEASASTTSLADRPTGVKSLSGPSWLEFAAPFGAIALTPSVSSLAAVSDGGFSADPWRIKSLRVEWDAASVLLILRVGRTSTAAPLPIYEIYMDFNHVLGAGRVPLLEGRNAVVAARDAWEMALSIIGDEARLYRARGGGSPDEISKLKAQLDTNEVRIRAPRSLMRGNPARWGWAVVALAEDPARAGRQPAAALVGADGTILLGALAPADLQKQILSRTHSRIPATRLEP